MTAPGSASGSDVHPRHASLLSRLHYWDGCFLARLLFFASTRVRVWAPERGKIPGGVIFAGNHISHFDPPLISTVAPRQLDWMAMEELFRNPLAARILHSYRAFSVERGTADRQALRIAMERLKTGAAVGIFPEGGLRAGPESILEGAPMRPGAALIACMARVPIVPFVILGSDRLYNKRRWLPWKRTPIWIGFGKPVFPDVSLPREKMRTQLSGALQRAILDLRDEMRQELRLSDADMPTTPQRRKGEE